MRIARRPGTRLRRAGLMLISALLSACGNLLPASQYRLYALDAVPALAMAPCPTSFSIREFRVAGYLDRDELVTAREGARIIASGEDVWAAPLKLDGSRVLTRLLLARLTGSQALAYPWRLNEHPAIALSIDIDRLEPVNGQLVAMIRWTILTADGKAGKLDQGSFETAVAMAGQSAGDLVGAINLALGRFADALATRATSSTGLATACRASG